ncbi:hypothetical protein AVEN_53341-1 [Araneus ventricosus]|uniref:Uncharacterized protein n=1 Tax=Araneus ventricosus TaxID=182803 RepID=A0A4Y2AAN2_ARAVE|nr:hypothetical protein AVEN_53341-1 [Araneus ventricosus]
MLEQCAFYKFSRTIRGNEKEDFFIVWGISKKPVWEESVIYSLRKGRVEQKERQVIFSVTVEGYVLCFQIESTSGRVPWDLERTFASREFLSCKHSKSPPCVFFCKMGTSCCCYLCGR